MKFLTTITKNYIVMTFVATDPISSSREAVTRIDFVAKIYSVNSHDRQSSKDNNCFWSNDNISV